MTNDELQREYLENAIKEQKIREKKRKIRKVFFIIDMGIILLMIIFLLKLCSAPNKTPKVVYDEATGQEIVTYIK